MIHDELTALDLGIIGVYLVAMVLIGVICV